MTTAQITTHPIDQSGRSVQPMFVIPVNTDGTIAAAPLESGGASEETQQAILAKLIAAPATAAKQDQIITLLTAMAASLVTIATNTTPAP